MVPRPRRGICLPFASVNFLTDSYWLLFTITAEIEGVQDATKEEAAEAVPEGSDEAKAAVEVGT